MPRCSKIVVHRGHNFFDNLLNLKRKIRISKDPLKFLLYMTDGCWKFRIIRFLAVMTVLAYLWNIVLFTSELLMTLNKKFALNYVGSIGMSLYILTNIGTILMNGDIFIKSAIEFHKQLLPLEFVSKQTNRKINRIILVLKIVVFSNYIAAWIAAIMIFNNDSFNNKKIYLVQFVRDWYPRIIAEKLIFLFRLSHLLAGNMVIVGSYIMSYVGFHTSFQLMLLKDFVQHICDKRSRENEQYYNETEQTLITQKLKICIMYQSFLNRQIRMMTAYNYRATLLYSSGTLLLGGGIMIELLSDHQEENAASSSPLGFFFIAIAGCLTTGTYASVGQMMKDESEDLRRKLTDLPWYNMNHHNKVLLGIFLMQTNQTISFDIDLLQMDNLLIVRILRGLYSMSTIVRTMQK